MNATARVTRRLAAAVLAGSAVLVAAPGAIAAPGALADQATEQALTVARPTLNTATLEPTPHGVGVDAVINLKFDAPIPSDPNVAYYNYIVRADGAYVSGTAFPHDFKNEFSIPLFEGDDGRLHVSGSFPDVTVTGKETYTVTTVVTTFGDGGASSQPSNGLVPTDLR